MTIRLNDDQARAAEHLEGPVLVTAGAANAH
jgi:superfamily I DNA/RNA helicase